MNFLVITISNVLLVTLLLTTKFVMIEPEERHSSDSTIVNAAVSHGAADHSINVVIRYVVLVDYANLYDCLKVWKLVC